MLSGGGGRSVGNSARSQGLTRAPDAPAMQQGTRVCVCIGRGSLGTLAGRVAAMFTQYPWNVRCPAAYCSHATAALRQPCAALPIQGHGVSVVPLGSFLGAGCGPAAATVAGSCHKRPLRWHGCQLPFSAQNRRASAALNSAAMLCVNPSVAVPHSRGRMNEGNVGCSSGRRCVAAAAGRRST